MKLIEKEAKRKQASTNKEQLLRHVSDTLYERGETKLASLILKTAGLKLKTAGSGSWIIAVSLTPAEVEQHGGIDELHVMQAMGEEFGGKMVSIGPQGDYSYHLKEWWPEWYALVGKYSNKPNKPIPRRELVRLYGAGKKRVAEIKKFAKMSKPDVELPQKSLWDHPVLHPFSWKKREKEFQKKFTPEMRLRIKIESALNHAEEIESIHHDLKKVLSDKTFKSFYGQTS